MHGGTVVRVNLTLSPTVMPAVQSLTATGSGFAERTDPAALVIGPTGVTLAPDGTLYAADSLNNRIASIGDAVNRTSSAGNGNNGSLIVLTSGGQMVSDGFLDKSGSPPELAHYSGRRPARFTLVTPGQQSTGRRGIFSLLTNDSSASFYKSVRYFSCLPCRQKHNIENSLIPREPDACLRGLQGIQLMEGFLT